MSLTNYFGFECPRCNSTVDIGVGSGDPTCPTCGTPMVPNTESRGAAANVYCKTCKAAYGLVNSNRCPQCGGPLSQMPT
jgi:hypothetical protein